MLEIAAHNVDHNLRPSRRKPIYPVNEDLRKYLTKWGREVNLPASYNDLYRFTYTLPLKDKFGKDTAWETVTYDMNHWNFLRESLVRIYAILKTEGDLSFINHLDVERIDFCSFGNSQPFRIRIINRYNQNYDHYYIKPADASRIYGLDLEHLLTPDRMIFLTNGQTLVEAHISGIPGDIFLTDYLHQPTTNAIRVAKEFVKFNERCFVRLLGDMRAHNFIVNVTPDIEDVQYRIRAIDFDQQSYEGRKNLYLPQFFKENYKYVEIAQKYLDKKSIAQYQAEERTIMAFRMVTSRQRIKELLDIMSEDTISTPEKIDQLRNELAEYFENTTFLKCMTMGQIVKKHIKQCLQKSLQLIALKPKNT